MTGPWRRTTTWSSTASPSFRRSSPRTRRPSSRWRPSRWTASGAWSSPIPGIRRLASPSSRTGTGSSSGPPRLPPVPEVASFSPQNKVRDVLNQLGERGRQLLLEHGYDVGEGFVDVLSQYQTLEHAAQTERLRDLAGLVAKLNTAQ